MILEPTMVAIISLFFAETSKMWLFKLKTTCDLAQTFVQNPETLK